MSSYRVSSLYTAAQSRAVDAFAIDHCELPGPVLMARAARAAFALLLEKHPRPELVQVFCGPGNNGGDGLLLALLTQGRGIATQVFLIDGEPRSVDAVAAAQRARDAGVCLREFSAADVEPRGVIVDAMLGTGISGKLRPAYEDAIAHLAGLQLPVLALDVPSGIDADTGAVQGVALPATWTVSFITAKRGLYTAQGLDYGGELSVDDLDVPSRAYRMDDEVCELLDLEILKTALPGRPGASHKGSFGRCLLIGGDRGMGGALLLATEAALRTGVGLVAAATRGEHVAPLLARSPECMVHDVEHRNQLEALLAWADAAVVGPGLGQGPWGQQMLHAALAAGKPLLLDADALNLLASGAGDKLPAGCVLTPHPGEAARLADATVAAVQADRFAAAQGIARRYGAVVVLKGAGSLIASGDRMALCGDGNPGMASGGMGDVLSGLIGGILAQGLAAPEAAALGTVLHARAGDRAAQDLGQVAMLASDLVPRAGSLLR